MIKIPGSEMYRIKLFFFCSTSNSACTWLFPSPDTPSLTLGLDALEVAELRELTDS